MVSPVRTSLLLRRFVFRMAEASAKRVTGDEPQGTMGRVQTAGEADVSPVVSFPPSIARVFSSKERRLGTRQSSDATLRGERMTARRVAQTWRKRGNIIGTLLRNLTTHGIFVEWNAPIACEERTFHVLVIIRASKHGIYSG